MLNIYIYKLLYHKYQIDVFLNKEKIKKFKLDNYKNFKGFININEEESLKFGLETINSENYKDTYEDMEKYKKDGFKYPIDKDNFNLEIIGIDNFFIISKNMVLSYLNRSDLKETKLFSNFYENICKPLFEDQKRELSKVIRFFYEPEKYKELQKTYNINSSDIEPLLYGYRFCINELFSKKEDEDGIYYPLYFKKNLDYLTKRFYPGNDTKNEPYYELYYKIKNHFNQNPNQGCYVCLCKTGYYHSIYSGLPGEEEKNMKCPNCKEPIGATCKVKALKKN